MVLNNNDFAIDLRDVTKVYRGGVQALRGVTMQVRRGEIFGLLGPNGAGKSTLVKIMMSIVKPTRAAGTLLGSRIGHKGTLRRVGYLPENHRFPRYLTGKQTLHFFSALSKVDRKTRIVRCGELLEAVGMAAWADTKVSQYSKGMMQRIGLAQSLSADPDLIVLDEPTDGVDPSGRKDIRDVLLALRQQGKTIFINSHLLSELETVSDRVAILVQGLVARQGTLDELTLGRQCYIIDVVSDSNPWDLMADALPGAFGAVELAERGGKWKPAGAMPPPLGVPPPLSETSFKPTSPLALKAPTPMGAPLRGQISKGPWCEFDGTTLRVGTVEVRDMQGIIDAVRRSGIMIRRVVIFRPSLEELFFEAVTNEATGQRLGPGAIKIGGAA